MFFCYILYSHKLDKYYIGSTSNLEGRLRRHLSNHNGFTGKETDWVVKWKQRFESKKEALVMERRIKSWKSRVLIGKLINDGVL